MEIRAGGRTWVVDAHRVAEGVVAGRECWDVTFSRPDRDAERVEMRWIPRPERLTKTLAGRLFELAGERLWRDPRDGVFYRIQLVDEGEPGNDADLSGGRILARFGTETETGMVPYELPCPLGLATDGDLEALADLALARNGGARA